MKLCEQTDEINDVLMGIKNSIYDVLNDEDIISYYLNISKVEINKLINDKSYRVSNTLRVDDNPSLGLLVKTYKYSDRRNIYIRDFADPSFDGDIFNLVGLILKKDCNTKTGFLAICNRIINDLIFNNGDISLIPLVDNVKTDKIIYHNTTTIEVEFAERSWSNNDLRYWYNIIKNKKLVSKLLDILRLEQVYIPRTIFVNNKLFYSYNPNDRCYVYFLERSSTGNSIIKAYFPDRKRSTIAAKSKFFTNDTSKYRALRTNSVKSTKMVITKSMKDALFLRLFLNLAGLEDIINIYYFQGETNYLTKDEYKTLIAPYDTKVWFLDYDKTGIFNTYYHIMYDNSIIPIFINGEDVNITNNEMSIFTSKINRAFNKNIHVNNLATFIDSFIERPYFIGIKDFTDLINLKSFRTTARYFKTITNTYLKNIKTIYK